MTVAPASSIACETIFPQGSIGAGDERNLALHSDPPVIAIRFIVQCFLSNFRTVA